MTTERERAMRPEDIARLLIERVNAGDLDGIVELFEPDAVIAFPPGQMTAGRAAIRAMYAGLLASNPRFGDEASLLPVISGDLALTSTRPLDNAGARAQVARRQPAGHWLRVLDRPEFA